MKCNMPGCDAVCKPMIVMCVKHWKIVPRAVQSWVMGESRPVWGPEGPSISWHVAVDVAIATVKAHDGESVTPESVMALIERHDVDVNTKVRARELLRLALLPRPKVEIERPKREAWSMAPEMVAHLFIAPEPGRYSLCGKTKWQRFFCTRREDEACFACTNLAQIDDRRRHR